MPQTRADVRRCTKIAQQQILRCESGARKRTER
jgi:hypothetical protein